MKADLLIVGAGALATFFAARLSAAGVDVTMLGSWQEGLAALRKTGARLDGGDSQIVQATDNPADCAGAKFALVLVKSWQTEHSASQLAECLAEDGLAVTLQNGLGNDTILSKSLGLQTGFPRRDYSWGDFAMLPAWFVPLAKERLHLIRIPGWPGWRRCCVRRDLM